MLQGNCDLAVQEPTDPSEKLSSPQAHATMSDVARKAGVSMKSVSRVINHELHVSKALRLKVETAIAALNYVPDTAARSLAGARSFTVGVLFDNPSPNYTMKVVSGAYAACIERQYHLRFDTIDTRMEPSQLDAAVEAMLRNSRCDGFVLTPPVCDNPRVLLAFERLGIRYSRLAPMYEPRRSMSVSIDDYGAGAAVADLLHDLGHRRFGLVNGPIEHGAAIMRRAGFIDRLRERNHVSDTAIVEAMGGFAFDKGMAAGNALLDRPDRPTAIFATNDDSAAGVIVAATALGLAIPHDVSICGFDDSWVAKTVWPYLTTVLQPIEDMASAAVRMIIDRKDNEPGARHLQLDYTVIRRGTTGQPATPG